jgi:hypothetical protein
MNGWIERAIQYDTNWTIENLFFNQDIKVSSLKKADTNKSTTHLVLIEVKPPCHYHSVSGKADGSHPQKMHINNGVAGHLSIPLK